MTTFEDGPAKGQTLWLRRSPKFLRVTVENGKFDALDQAEDIPKQTELIYAYELTGTPGLIHVAGKGFSGFYTTACYKLVKIQPTDAQMRNLRKWSVWCDNFDREAL